MAPHQGGRYTHQNLSNPFAHLNQPTSIHQQASHVQHQNLNLPNHGFGSMNHNGGTNIFGPQGGVSGLPSGFGAGGGLGGGGTGLASHAAVMGFAHGAALQQQQAAHDAMSAANQARTGHGRIREVWKHNLHEEMAVLRELVDRYPYISMVRPQNLGPQGGSGWLTLRLKDTEFPGVVARPIGEFTSKANYHYQTLRANADLLKIIQLGITLFSGDGEPVPATEFHDSRFPRNKLPKSYMLNVAPCTWSFHFRFSLEDDMYSEESITLLKKAGADFDKHATHGIDPDEFGSLLITSGLVLSDDVWWISFHSGYDFAYLMKIMLPKLLPNDEDEYRELVKTFFPNIYDVKYMLRHAQNMVRRGTLGQSGTNFITNLGTKSGLQDLAEELNCPRVGIAHHSGSDAWLTGTVFWQMKAKVFDSSLSDELKGEMWGLTGVGPPASAAAQAMALAHAGQVNAANGMAGVANSSIAGTMNFGLTASSHRDGAPSTPTTNPAGLAQTPGPNQGFQPAMTPGAGGVFGNFTYAK